MNIVFFVPLVYPNAFEMQKTVSNLDTLQALINSEWARYKQAITNGKEFDEVKTIYRRIKELEKEADTLMLLANELYRKNKSESV